MAAASGKAYRRHLRHNSLSKSFLDVPIVIRQVHHEASHLADVYEPHTALETSSPFSQQYIFVVSNDWQTGHCHFFIPFVAKATALSKPILCLFSSMLPVPYIDLILIYNAADKHREYLTYHLTRSSYSLLHSRRLRSTSTITLHRIFGKFALVEI